VRVNGEQQPVVPAAVRETFEGGHGGEWIHAKPAVLGRDEQALDSEGATLFPSVMVENAIAVVFDHVVVELLAGETADCVQ
jgi:hypothetical protein